MAGIGQGGAQVIDVSEAVKAGYAVLGNNLTLVQNMLNNSKRTQEVDYTEIEKLNAQAMAMDDQEVENDITIARDWYAEQVKSGRNVNTPKFRAEFRSRMAGITGKVAGIKGMRDEIASQIDVLSKLKDPYSDNNSKITKLMEIRNRRPDNWKHEVSKIVNDPSSYKLGDKTKDVSIAIGNNQKTVAWEKPTGKKGADGAILTDTVNTTYNPFFEDFNAETGEVTQKTQLDYDFLNNYLADNPEHASALQVKRVDVQDDIIATQIALGQDLTPDQQAWSTMTNAMKLQKALNDDLIQYGRPFAKGSKEGFGIGTAGGGERADYYGRQATAEEVKQQKVDEAIKNDANTMRTRGEETLNSMQIKGVVPGSFNFRETKSKAGEPMLVVEYVMETPQYTMRKDAEGNDIRQIVKGRFERTKVSEPILMDKDDDLAKFLRDRIGYGRAYGPENLMTTAPPIEAEGPKKEPFQNTPLYTPSEESTTEDPLKKFLK